LIAQQSTAPQPPLDPQTRAVLDRISADSLRGHLSFIASDLLEGRGTPSRGLDLAAEYIAAQFRRAGLEPIGKDGYYQTDEMIQVEPVKTGFEMNIDVDGRSISIPREQITPRFRSPLDIKDARIYKLDREHDIPRSQDLEDSVVITELPEFSGAGATEAIRKFRKLAAALEKAKPKLTLMLSVDGLAELDTNLVIPKAFSSDESPAIIVRNEETLKWYAAVKAGATSAVLGLREPAAVETHVKVHNVIGLLRGSDPVLKDTYMLVTAHYDHLGMRPNGTGDRIYNGANDDGSGTVSVIELASALATLNPRPKRSIVFMMFFGEEEGTLGSKFYASHPVFPIAKTIADVNLEQVGRTDDVDGPKVSQATFTGYPYSDLPRVFRVAGARTGVRVLSDEKYGDSFFVRSDNAALADEGVPAHTLAVALDFPDYHKVSDKWQKINYDNMAKVDRMLALGLMMLADNPVPPKWNESNSKTEKYVKAWKMHHAR
jgi:hypothetical protein